MTALVMVNVGAFVGSLAFFLGGALARRGLSAKRRALDAATRALNAREEHYEEHVRPLRERLDELETPRDAALARILGRSMRW